MLSKLDRTIIRSISKGIPLAREPFKKLAKKLGIKEQALLKRIESYKKNGLMRKFCASLNHKKIGIRYNAMVVWNVPEALLNKAGLFAASLPQVSHCYERARRPDWDYNLYSMIHGRTEKECLSAVEKILKTIGSVEHRVLFSSEEYKKTGARF
jgi:DNA-binding Lrp family transcriptional regulator